MTKRQLARWQREKRRQRLLFITIGFVAVVVVGVLGFGLFYEYVAKPSAAVATVNGETIRRDTYEKMRKLQILEQNYASQQQDPTAAGTLNTQLAQVKDEQPQSQTVDQMVEDTLLAQKASSLGISVSNSEVDAEIAKQFPKPEATPAPSSAPVTGTTTPSPTASPAAGVTPSASATPSTGVTSSNGVTPSASSQPTLTVQGKATPAPSLDQAAYSNFLSLLKNTIGFSEQDYRDLVVRPQLMRQKLQDRMNATVPNVAEQVHAEHILLKTEDDAKAVLAELKQGKDFAELAKQKSEDPGSKDSGGDLGWFQRGMMVSEFDSAAFNTKVGDLVGPVKTTYGYHIIKVLEKQANRPLMADQQQQAQALALQNWWDKEKKAASIQEFTAPTPTPFIPPTVPLEPTVPPTPASSGTPQESPVSPSSEGVTSTNGVSPTTSSPAPAVTP